MGQLLSESKPASSTSNRPSTASCSCDEELSKLKMEEVLQQRSHIRHVSVGEILEMWVPRTISAHTERTLGGDVCHVIMIPDLRAFVRQNDHVKPHTTSRKRSERPSCDGQLSEKYYFSSSSRRIWPWRHNMARQRKAGLSQSSTKVLYKKTLDPLAEITIVYQLCNLDLKCLSTTSLISPEVFYCGLNIRGEHMTKMSHLTKMSRIKCAARPDFRFWFQEKQLNWPWPFTQQTFFWIRNVQIFGFLKQFLTIKSRRTRQKVTNSEKLTPSPEEKC